MTHNKNGYAIILILILAGSLTIHAEAASRDALIMQVGIGAVLEDFDGVEEMAVLSPVITAYKNLGMATVDKYLNIRESPGEGGKIIGKMPNDAACEIIETVDGWAKIKSGEVEGYVSTDYLLTGESAIRRANEVLCPMAVVTADALKVREKPSTDCEVVMLVAKGEELEIAEPDSEGWTGILLDGEEVYVSSEYVNIEEKLKTAITLTELLYGEGVTDVRVDVCEYAKQFLGNSYVYGGSSLSNGTDCSGFTMGIYKKFGISLPHSACQQATYGTAITAAQLQPGDLIFYKKGGVINHVTMYIGNGQVIHASSPSTGIRISQYGYRTPYCMRRILP